MQQVGRWKKSTRRWTEPTAAIGERVQVRSAAHPGKQNSVFTNFIPANASLSCSPNPFSPDGDGFQDVTIIQYSGPASLATIRIRIYDSMGRLVRTLADAEPAGAHGSVVWNGLNDRGERVRIGIYIILLETIISNGMTVQTVKGTVVVATKL